MYRAAKRDRVEPKIISFLERLGASVTQIDEAGVPDLLVGICGINLLIEVKGERGRLTIRQREFFSAWQGQVTVVRSVADVKELLRSIMPVYHYRCIACEQEFEKVQRMTEPALKECPYCHGDVIRVPQAVGVIYRTGGFYSKDSRSKEPKSTKE